MLGHMYLELITRQHSVYYRLRSILCKKENIAPTAFDIIMFLFNHPNNNTAKEICVMRGIKSGIVSVEVEKLVKDGFLVRETDAKDRRKQRLTLTTKVKSITEQGEKLQKDFFIKLFSDLTVSEQKSYEKILQKMSQTIDNLEAEIHDKTSAK